MGDGAPISQEIRLPTKSDEVATATKKLDELIARVDKLDQRTERHHKKSEAGWKGVGQTIEDTKRKTKDFFEFIGAVAAFEILDKIADKFIDIGREALTAAAKAERMNFAIDAAAGGKEKGDQVRKFVGENAKFSEFSEGENESAYLRLKRFGVEDQKAGLYMKAAEDLAAMAGPDERKGVYDEALSAFTRMHARGKLDMRSAMRLGLGVEDFKQLPQFQGKSNKAISKAMQSGSGNVTENDILGMIIKHTGEKGLGERAAQASQLLLTRWTKITELPERFYKRLAETTAITKLSNALGGMLDKLDPDSPLGKRIFGGLESTFASLADKIGEIDFETLGETITRDVIPAMKAMIGMIAPMIEGFERLFRGAHRMHDMFAGGEKGATARSEAAASLKGAVGIDTTKSVPTSAASHIPLLGWFVRRGEAATAEKAAAAGRAHAAGYAGGIDKSSGMSEAAASSTGESSHEALMSSIDARSPSRKTQEAGAYFGEGFAIGIERSAGRIEDAIDSTFHVPAGRFNPPSVAGGRGMRLTIGDINITVAGGNTNAETAGALIDELKKSLKPMFVDLMDEVDAEAEA